MNLETLLAEREIHRALVTFAYAMDHREWHMLEQVVRADATADVGFGLVQGRDAFITGMRSFLDDCGPTQHLLGNVMIDVDGDTASSRVYVSDMHKGVGEKSDSTFSTLGEYHDKWRRIDGAWYMTHRTKLNRATIGDISVLGAGPG